MPLAAPVNLEFTLRPEDAALLLRAPPLAARRHGRMRTAPAHMVWHDTANFSLARSGLALAEQRGLWQLERLVPASPGEWLPAHAPPLLAEAATPEQLGIDLPPGLVPVAAFAGRRRVMQLDTANEATLTLLEGTLRGVARDFASARIVMSGKAADMAALAIALGDHVALSVPRSGLAAEAARLVANRPATPRALGIPAVPRGATAQDALGIITAHLADAILHWAALVPGAASSEPVHQMRVAVRRLRSALSLFRRAAAERLPPGLSLALKSLAASLGAARDWDVFLGGTGAAIARAFEGDRRIAGLIKAATRRQAAAYAELRILFAGGAWRRLAMELALLPTLRPWSAGGDDLERPACDYAASMLDRRAKHLFAAGPDLSGLSGEPLHDIRKQAKRLRYASEFFAPLFAEKAARKYLRRLADLQEALGTVNDAAAAAVMVATLGGGADRAFAAGCVQGYLAAGNVEAAASANRAWQRVCGATPFWD
jgi:CHAD domain-containing protein